jgi:alpha-L-rhamnosidase
VEGEQKDAMGERLRHLVRAHGYHVATGFVGTPILCDALTETGHADAASRLLVQTECPSWLYPVIADWLHRCVAGLAPLEPGYRRIRVAPILLDALDDASAWHDTPYGRASSGWSREEDQVRLHVEVPPNTRAVVRLPSGAEHEVGSGTHTWAESHPRPRRTRTAWGLDSDLATIVDDAEAYQAVLAAIASVDPERAAAFRRTTRWTPGRRLRDPSDSRSYRGFRQRRRGPGRCRRTVRTGRSARRAP